MTTPTMDLETLDASDPTGAEDSAPLTPTDSATPTEPTPDAVPVETPTDGDPAADAAPVVEEPPKPTPFTARVMGAKYEADQLGLSGAVVRHDGTIEVPASSSARLAQLISKGRMYEERVPQQLHEAREQARQAQAQFHEEAERGKAMFAFFSDLVGKGEQEIYNFLTEWATNKPKLDGMVERALAQAERDRMTRGAAGGAPTNLPESVIEQQAQDAALQATLGLVPKYKGMTQAKAIEIADAMWAKRSALYLGVADRDYPEFGVMRGQPVFRQAQWEEDLRERFDLETRAAQQVAKAAAVAPKVSAAAAGNTAVVQGKGTKAPPPPAAAAASATTTGKPKTKAEYDAMMRQKYGIL